LAEIAKGPLTPPAPLTAGHELGQFACGKPELDDWLKDRALESEGRTARTYVVCEPRRVVVGYYCIATGSVERRALPSAMKRARGLPNQIPVAIIGRLARDRRYAGKGLGRDLLQDALNRILAASRVIGIRAVLVHALDEEAAEFWRDHEFMECPIGSGTFYLPVETIADAI
jgi:GNAT superfamily N-acetyltransferase